MSSSAGAVRFSPPGSAGNGSQNAASEAFPGPGLRLRRLLRGDHSAIGRAARLRFEGGLWAPALTVTVCCKQDRREEQEQSQCI